jgi:biotin-dependent carboxylase-like uncharacterized protein
MSNPAFFVLEPGFMCTIQDGGRYGLQRYGMPVAGALDDVSRQIANMLVHNAKDAAVLEIIGPGPTLRLDADCAHIAAAGCVSAVEVIRSNGKAMTIAAYQSAILSRGDVLRLPAPRGGAVYCVAVEGGFAIAPTLGSRATYTRAGIGGWHGRALAASDRLPLASQSTPRHGELRTSCRVEAPAHLRVILGPQHGAFTHDAIAAFLSAEWKVSAASDRMGLRLEGPSLTHIGAAEVRSQGIAAGAIQVPGSGQPIILLADRQTTGGYPIIATVISADIAAAGRLSPGMAFRFEAVTYHEAMEARRGLQAWLAEAEVRLEPVATPLSTETLLTHNLIGGVTDGSI